MLLKLSTLEPHPTRDLPVDNSSSIQLFNVMYLEQQGALLNKKKYIKQSNFKYLIICSSRPFPSLCMQPSDLAVQFISMFGIWRLCE